MTSTELDAVGEIKLGKIYFRVEIEFVERALETEN
jgi:hypothetical protein